jgi:hypothetical protein
MKNPQKKRKRKKKRHGINVMVGGFCWVSELMENFGHGGWLRLGSVVALILWGDWFFAMVEDAEGMKTLRKKKAWDQCYSHEFLSFDTM